MYPHPPHHLLIPSWKAKIPERFKELSAYYRTRRYIAMFTNPIRVHILSQINPAYCKYISCRSILIISTLLRLALSSRPWLQVPPHQIRVFTSPLPHTYVPHASPIPFCLIRSPKWYLASSTNHKRPNYAICTNSCYLVPHRPRYPLQYSTHKQSQPVLQCDRSILKTVCSTHG